MIEAFIRTRIAQLRTEKGISARDLSLTLGMNSAYINKIEKGKCLPSYEKLFEICEYFGITLQQFFQEEDIYPLRLAEMITRMKRLDTASLDLVSELVKKLSGE